VMTQVSIIPTLHIWSNQLLFVGAYKIPYREHQVVSDKLMISTQGEMKITLEDGSQISTRTCLTKAGAILNDQYIDANNAIMAIYYLAPLTQDYSALESQMVKAHEGLHYDHPQDDLLIQQLLDIRNESLSPEQAYLELRDFIVPRLLHSVVFRGFDPRIIEVVRRIRETVRDNLSVSEFAKEVHLSESRLDKLFKEQMALGRSVTDAAHAAGFASTAHFSKSFSAINGIPPSATFLRPPFLNVLIAEEVLGMMKADSTIAESK
jgi:AraC-like DNA-binding protein